MVILADAFHSSRVLVPPPLPNPVIKTITPMQQRKEINFEGQNIHIGIDVHLKNWSVITITQSGYKKTHNQNFSARELFEHLRKHYLGGKYQVVYESGFTRFSTYYALKEYGIDCMVIHAADVPTTQYESVMVAAYGEYCKRMKSQEAVIRIARKLANRILKILRSEQKYEYDQCH